MDLSIIIPCYNSGAYLNDALNSIELAIEGKKYLYEVIIVDDGSDDLPTKKLLEGLPKEKYIVLNRANGGPAAARNTAIEKAQGEYLIFLDSDNKLKSTYLEKTLEACQRTGADIIHCRSDFFGDTTVPRFVTGPFDINKMLIENYIDMCCLIPRKVFDKIGRFDEAPQVRGFEDWEFFIRAYAAGCIFQYVDEPVYDYRVRAGSLSQQHSYEYLQAVKYYVYKKHIGVFTAGMEWYYGQYKMQQMDHKSPFRSVLKYLYYGFRSIWRNLKSYRRNFLNSQK